MIANVRVKAPPGVDEAALAKAVEDAARRDSEYADPRVPDLCVVAELEKEEA